MEDLLYFGDVITKIRDHSGKNDKVAILKDELNGANSEVFAKLLNYALSPYITFGIKKIPAPVNIGVSTYEEVDVYSLLDKLASRELTGDAAKLTIVNVLGTLSENAQHALTRILSKDLKAGFSASSVNKAKKKTIDVFNCQLANSGQADTAKLKYPQIVEIKYDGVRDLSRVFGTSISMLSRSGKPFVNFRDVEDDLMCLKNAYEQVTGNNSGAMFDGEMISGIPGLSPEEGFQKVMNRAKSDTGKHVEDNPVVYAIFDVIPLSEWDEQKCSMSLMERSVALNKAFEIAKPTTLIRSPQYIARDEDHLIELYQKICDDGYEGIITKAPHSFYKYKRNKDWQKLKPFETIDLEVTGMEEGTGKNEGSLGAIACRGEHEGKLIKTKVGSGLSDADRAEIWKNYLAGKTAKDDGVDGIGSILESRYQDITKSPDNDNYSLRFPTFVRWRGDIRSGKI